MCICACVCISVNVCLDFNYIVLDVSIKCILTAVLFKLEECTKHEVMGWRDQSCSHLSYLFVMLPISVPKRNFFFFHVMYSRMFKWAYVYCSKGLECRTCSKALLWMLNIKTFLNLFDVLIEYARKNFLCSSCAWYELNHTSLFLFGRVLLTCLFTVSVIHLINTHCTVYVC